MEKGSFKRALLAPVLAIALVGAGYGLAKFEKTPDAAAAPTGKVTEPAMVPANFSDLAESVRPGVVNIQVVKKVKNVAFGSRGFRGNPFGEDSPFGDFFGPFSQGTPAPEQQQQG